MGNFAVFRDNICGFMPCCVVLDIEVIDIQAGECCIRVGNSTVKKKFECCMGDGGARRVDVAFGTFAFLYAVSDAGAALADIVVGVTFCSGSVGNFGYSDAWGSVAVGVVKSKGAPCSEMTVPFFDMGCHPKVLVRA